MTLQELEQEAGERPVALQELSHNLVFGEGNPDARLMLVGEAPGEEEDRAGRPFVGRAGQLLDRVLASVGLDRDDIYITNMVKFRPPGNRNPRPEEIAASEPVLLEQIRLIRPQIIATLGNVPTQYFLGTKDGITRTHGKWFEWQGLRVFPLYHPAYLLRNPSRERGGPKWQTWQDMQELVRVLASLPVKAAGLHIDTAHQEGLF
ncbi:MAG TPA: uracil-DNA glycosylase [Trueperaceae bacterium]|nr:uracil-DNA glycosylase [Trueperaceae bacterium]